nr:MAG TPA: YvrJ protein family protein [Caudoviricetes sp.]
MEINSILQAVSTVGFPIAMCLICSYYIVNLNKEHKEETEKLTEALNNNTLVLQKLCDTIGVEREV